MKLEQLANLKIGKKPSKQVAWAIFSEMVESENFCELHLAQLYSFFTPPMPSKPKTVHHWLAKAMGNKDVRYYLNYIHVEGNRICATDGHHLHYAKNNDNLPDGYYDKNLILAEAPDFAKYPDITRVTPDLGKGNYYNLDYDIDNLKVRLLGKSSEEIIIFTLRDGKELGIDKSFFMQAVSLEGNNMKLWVESPTSSVLVRSALTESYAVIMPIRL